MPPSELTAFFLSHRGRCFEGWTVDKIFQYILVNIVHGNIFATRDHSGAIALAAIAWPDDAARITALDAFRKPLWDWQCFPKTGDSIVIADVAGARVLMPEILKQAMARWCDGPRRCHALAMFGKRLFTYRRGKLVELSWKTVLRFCQQSRDHEGAVLTE